MKPFAAVTDEGSTILNDCVTQELPGFQVEACFCQDNLCNGAKAVFESFVILLLPTIVLWAATA